MILNSGNIVFGESRLIYVAILFSVLVGAIVYQYLVGISKKYRSHRGQRSRSFDIRPVKEDDAKEWVGCPTCTKTEDTHDNALGFYKEIYYKLHNLEQDPDILPASWELLVNLLSEAIAENQKSSSSSILAVECFNAANLQSFLQSEDDNVTIGWKEYLARRKSGLPMELFQSKEEAGEWLKQSAPAKFVDGAWLGHVNKVTTSFNLRPTTKIAWQVFSEEYGDGELSRHHVHVYQNLLHSVGCSLPKAHSADFTRPELGLDQLSVWKSAVAQLLISLFPNEMLPEILGFNLHYELLTIDTLKASKELEELKIDPYYFVLHISIDNADSGHTAIAMHSVCRYLEYVEKHEGEAAMAIAWKRVQAGYLLSKSLPTTPESDSTAKNRPPVEAKLLRIFKDKARAAQHVHCGNRAKIGGRSLTQWLAPETFESEVEQTEFLASLGGSKPWVFKGDSNRSRLVKALGWNGKMFGAFTQKEVKVVKQWIDTLGAEKTYWSFTGQSRVTRENFKSSRDVSSDYPVFATRSSTGASKTIAPSPPSPNLLSIGGRHHTGSFTFEPSSFFPLWFSHPCLLECFISIPSKTADTAMCAIVRFLRAQHGFDDEGPGVAGMDEVQQPASKSLVEIGQNMLKNVGEPDLKSLKEVLQRWACDFSVQMLQLAMRPMENAALLLGMASAFVDLHRLVATSSILSVDDQRTLAWIADREERSLKACVEDLDAAEFQKERYLEGQQMARKAINSCVGSET